MKNEEYGEFSCSVCDKIFHIKSQLKKHMGHHIRGTKPICKVCKIPLNNKNWYASLQRYSNRTCKKCMKQKNKSAYMKKKQKRMEGNK